MSKITIERETLQAGLNNAELLAAWMKKLPGVEPSEKQLTAFALGAEVGFSHAQHLERQDWSRVHHALKDAGVHPGRTDEHLADVIARVLRAALAAQPAEPVEPVAMSNEDAFTVWVEEESADFPTLDREHLRNLLRNAWIAGHNACVDAAPPAPAAVPLTDEQIIAIANSIDDDACDQSQTTAFARAIERAHGIAAAGENQ